MSVRGGKTSDGFGSRQKSKSLSSCLHPFSPLLFPSLLLLRLLAAILKAGFPSPQPPQPPKVGTKLESMVEKGTGDFTIGC